MKHTINKAIFTNIHTHAQKDRIGNAFCTVSPSLLPSHSHSIHHQQKESCVLNKVEEMVTGCRKPLVETSLALMLIPLE